MSEQHHGSINYDEISPELQAKLQKMGATLGPEKPNLSPEKLAILENKENQDKTQLFERIDLLDKQLDELRVNNFLIKEGLADLKSKVDSNQLPLADAWKEFIAVSQELTPYALEANQKSESAFSQFLRRLSGVFAKKSPSSQPRL